MIVIDFKFQDWSTFTITINWLSLIIIVAAVWGAGWLWRNIKRHSQFGLVLKKVSFKVGDQTFEFEVDHKIQEIAYKIWVELSTRKIGLKYEEDKDVIVEVYDSWYEAFKIIREFMEEIPVSEVGKAKELINATLMVLNLELRPHLTTWQAKFRKWYEEALTVDEEDRHDSKTPQEIQEKYPEYNALVTDLERVNMEMVNYCDQLRKIAFRE